MTNRGDRGNLIVHVTRTSSHKTISTLAPHQCTVCGSIRKYTPTNRNGSCTRAAANRPEVVVVVVELIQSSARPSDLRSTVAAVAATDSRKSPSALK